MAGGAGKGARVRWALSPRAARLRTHPVVLGSLVLLVVNDHLLKQRWPGPVTGIASDVAGLVLLPVAIVLVLDAARARPVDRRTMVAASAVVALGFAAVELVPVADAAYEVGLGVVGWPVRTLLGGDGGWRVVATADPWDLLALPFAAAGACLWSGAKGPALRARRGSTARPRLGPVVVLALAPALLATSPEPAPRTTQRVDIPTPRLDAEHPSTSYLVDLTARGANSIELSTDAWRNEQGTRPDVLVTSSVIASSGPGTVLDHRPDGMAAVDPTTSQPMYLGRCASRCSVQLRIVVQLEDPTAGAWQQPLEVEVTAEGMDDAEPFLRLRAQPEPSAPSDEVARIVARGTLRGSPPPDDRDGRALVLRATAPDGASLQVAQVALEAGGPGSAGIDALEPAEVEPHLGYEDPILDGRAGSCRPAPVGCTVEAALLPQWSDGQVRPLLAVRTGLPVDGLDVSFVPATWRRHRFRPPTDQDREVVEATVPPGHELLVELRRPEGERAPHEDRLALEVTGSTGDEVAVPEQPALTSAEVCPAESPTPCRVTIRVGSTGVGQIELIVLTVPL